MALTHSKMTSPWKAGISTVSLALGAVFMGGSLSAAAAPFAFDMAVSAAATACLPNAGGHVMISDAGETNVCR